MMWIDQQVIFYFLFPSRIIYHIIWWIVVINSSFLKKFFGKNIYSPSPSWSSHEKMRMLKSKKKTLVKIWEEILLFIYYCKFITYQFILTNCSKGMMKYHNFMGAQYHRCVYDIICLKKCDDIMVGLCACVIVVS